MGTRNIRFEKNVRDTLETMQQHGLLLSSVGAEGRPNVMTIGWGCTGIIWGKPIFTVLVRPSRFTFQSIQASGEFVVNVPDASLVEAVSTRLSGFTVDPRSA